MYMFGPLQSDTVPVYEILCPAPHNTLMKLLAVRCVADIALLRSENNFKWIEVDLDDLVLW